MTIVSITQAAKLVRRGRASLYRDIEKGIVSKTVSASGEAGIDTSELIRAYGKLHPPETSGVTGIADFETKVNGWTHGRIDSNMPIGTPGDTHRITILELELRSREEKISQLERIVALERESRQLAAASMKRELDGMGQVLDGKEQVIKLLENQVLMLEYTAKPAAQKPVGFWSRIFGRSP